MGKKRNAVLDSSGTRLRRSSKRRKTVSTQPTSDQGQHAVLRLHYENVSTLRDYILERFPKSSKSRKQRLNGITVWSNDQQCEVVASTTGHSLSTTLPIGPASSMRDNHHSELSRLLDTTIIGYTLDKSHNAALTAMTTSHQVQTIYQLSQKLRSTARGISSQAGPSQNEIVDFAVGHLFNTVHHSSRIQTHVLCNGFVRHPPSNGFVNVWSNGLYCTFPNCNAATMQRGAWPALLKLLGKDGDQVILDMLLHCAVFVPLESGRNNLCQISGIQLSEIPLLGSGISAENATRLIPQARPSSADNKPTQIKIIRNRMFYARPALNGKGMVKLGLQHIHVFNRYSDASNPAHIAHILKYMFPRQFGLHNVFTCKPDRRDTVQAQKDYTMREQEIMIALRRQGRKLKSDEKASMKIPKRLRVVSILITRILKRHARCAYVELLRHHCPVKVIDTPASNHPQDSINLNHGGEITDLATLPEYVYAFCRSVLLRVLPPEMFDGDSRKSPNFRLLLQSVLDFVQSRKRETLDLHLIVQGFKPSHVPWLTPPNSKQGSKLALSDYLKRKELLEELLYYIFDSILIPLIRSNFHVTESNNNVHQLFYFRHDVWRRLTQPFLNELQLSMFEVHAGSKKEKAKLQTMPYGHMRLVPKGSTFRPIMNLKRRPMIQQDGRWILGPRSVNTMLKPVYSMIKHEKLKQPGLLGSSMFSVDEVYPKLKRFSEMLKATNRSNAPLYFAKVDVTHCFDTIPQDAVLGLMEDICNQDDYCSVRHAEVSTRHTDETSTHPLTKRFRDREPARAMTDVQSFQEYISNQYGNQRKNTIFIEQGAPLPIARENLMKLLHDHISSMNVKLGKKFLQQKRGIPQGSILSSVLCNFFYGQFEDECLGFLQADDSLLMRLLDDFLLITLDRSTALRFLEVMHAGNTKYGITIKSAKSLSNIPFSYENKPIPSCNSRWFPYCGKSIHTSTLSISRDRTRHPESRIHETISLERSSHPGSAFHRLTLDALKRVLQPQYTDTTINSAVTVLETLHGDFVHSALRTVTYIRGLGPRLRPRADLLIRTIEDLADMTVSIIRAGTGSGSSSSSRSAFEQHNTKSPYECCVKPGEVKYLLTRAFRDVFGRNTSGGLIDERVRTWLDGRLQAEWEGLAGGGGRSRRRVSRVIAGMVG